MLIYVLNHNTWDGGHRIIDKQRPFIFLAGLNEKEMDSHSGSTDCPLCARHLERSRNVLKLLRLLSALRDSTREWGSGGELNVNIVM